MLYHQWLLQLAIKLKLLTTLYLLTNSDKANTEASKARGGDRVLIISFEHLDGWMFLKPETPGLSVKGANKFLLFIMRRILMNTTKPCMPKIYTHIPQFPYKY